MCLHCRRQPPRRIGWVYSQKLLHEPFRALHIINVGILGVGERCTGQSEHEAAGNDVEAQTLHQAGVDVLAGGETFPLDRVGSESVARSVRAL